MRVAYLGAGTWGFCLAALLAANGHEVRLWARNADLAKKLNKDRIHPDLLGFVADPRLTVTDNLQEALIGCGMIVESVTSAGIRPVFSQVRSLLVPSCPIVITSKGIEQNTELLLSEVLLEVLGEDSKPFLACLCGPSHAEEVVKNLPTSVVASGYEEDAIHLVRDAFTTPTFRIYPNQDMNGVQFGAAMKNIIAIASGLSDGLGFGDNTKAALMTRGLHEIRKLSVTKGARPETLNGLAGMGDLCVTCLSTLSRNYRFGKLVAEGHTPTAAKEKIGVAVEGAYTCLSALQLGHHHRIEIPITEAVHSIIYENVNAKEAAKALLQRVTKEEHL